MCSWGVAELLCICSDLPIFCPTVTNPDPVSLLSASPGLRVHHSSQQAPTLFSLKHFQDLLRDNLKLFDQCRHTGLVSDSEGAAGDHSAADLGRHETGPLVEDAIRETSNNAYRGDYQPRTYLSDVIYQQNSDPIPVCQYEVMTLFTPWEVSFITSNYST